MSYSPRVNSMMLANSKTKDLSMGRGMLLFLAGFLAVGLTAGPGQGQSDWISVTPEGATLNSVTVDRQNAGWIYARTTSNQTYLSRDSGGQWEELAPSQTGGGVILVDPENSDRLYIGSWNKFLWSEDAGQNWQSVDIGFAVSTLTGTLAGDKVTLFATAYGGSIAGSNVDSLFRSTDRGQSWERVTSIGSVGSAEDPLRITVVAADPHSPTRLYAGTVEGLFFTEDSGDSWTQLDNANNDVLAVSGRTVYSRRSNKLFRSDNGGQSWEGLNEWSVYLAASPGNPKVAYRSGKFVSDFELHRSTDGGLNWEPIYTAGPSSLPKVYFDSGDPSIVYMFVDNGLQKRDFDDPAYEPPAEEEEEVVVSSDPRRASFWTRLRTVNLGPKGGNGVQGSNITVERQGNRIYTGNQGNVSIADPALDLVTGVIRRDQLPEENWNAANFAVAVHEGRNEIYLIPNQGRDLLILDRNTQQFKSEIELFVTSFRDISAGASGRWGYARPMIVDETANRLYVGNDKSVSVVDLQAGQTLVQVRTNTAVVSGVTEAFQAERRGVTDLALDRENSRLYAAIAADNLIEVIDLESQEVVNSIQLEVHPLQLDLDPGQPYLYVAGIEPMAAYNEQTRTHMVRIDLNSGTVDGQIPLSEEGWQNETARMVLDPTARKLIVSLSARVLRGASNSLLNGFSQPSKRLVVDLDGFQVEEEGDWPSIIQALQIDPVREEVLALGVDNLLHRTDVRGSSVRSVIQIGADPQGVAISEARNLTYVPRGMQGAFLIVDAEGTIIGSVEGTPTAEVVVDDLLDRLYTREIGSKIGVYELSSLRRLNTVDVPFGVQRISPMGVDHKRNVLWLPAGFRVHKLDPLTGRSLKQVDLSEAYDLMALDADRDRAYMADSGTFGKTLGVFDLEGETLLETIDISGPFDGVDVAVLSLGLDQQNQRLYVWGWARDKGHFVQTVDLVQNVIIDTYDTGLEKNKIFSVLFDTRRHIAYTTFGHIVDLEARTAGSSFTGGFGEPIGDYFVLNRLTNTIYMIVGGRGQGFDEGMDVYLGPAGTEVQPPPVPQEVTVTAGDEQVEVAWSAVDDSTLVGYHVYRQDRSGVPFARITPRPLTDTSLIDLDLTNGQTYSYQLSSVGQAALESIARTTPAPVIPTGGGSFRLLLLRQSVALVPGDSLTLPISIESLEEFDDEVTLSAAAPTGVEFVFPLEKVVPPRVVGVTVRAAADAPVGRFNVTLQGEGGGRSQETSLVVEVTERGQEESVLTLELDQEEVPLDIPLIASGRLFPGLRDISVQLDFRAVRADTLITRTVETETGGGYRVEFQAPFADRWNVTASWTGTDDFEGASSRTVAFAVTSGKSRITATSDLVDDADLGFIATLKGRIHPSPGTVGVNITVRRPDGTEETIEGVLSSAGGFYGHDLPMNQAGIWEVWASWKGNDQLLGAVSPVITVPVQTDVGRVILLAGGQDSNRDVFWPTSNYLGNLAYTTFQKRRLVKEKIFYLNDRQEQDVDKDGFQEDVDEGATMSAWSDAWTWARERVQSGSPLYIYLVGKGQPTGLEIGDGEILTATQLLQDLSALEEATGAQATLIVDASHAGHFIRDLSDQGRHVIASTGLGPAFYQAEGYLSFSQYFLTDLFQGKSLQEAFLHTDQILRNLPGAFRRQDPGLEAEGNLIPNQPGDYLRTLDAIIGAPFELGDLSPQIKASSLSSVVGGAGKQVVTQTLPVSEDPGGPRLKLARSLAEQGVEISARIDDPEGALAVVRAMIIPPESEEEEELTQYPEVELEPDGTGRWVGVSHEFLEEGVYPVIIYAIDGAGNAAEPLRTTVLVEPPPPLPTGDFSGDGLVDFADFFMFADAFGGDDPAYDLDQSGLVDFGDFFLFADAFGGPLGKLLALAEEMLHLPTEYSLRAPYPNPFNSEVVVKYSLPREGDVELVVYNTLGQVVRRLATGHQRLGHHRVVWDGRDDVGRSLATGTYLVQLRAGEWRSDGSRPADLRFRQVRKVAFVK